MQGLSVNRMANPHFQFSAGLTDLMLSFLVKSQALAPPLAHLEKRCLGGRAFLLGFAVRHIKKEDIGPGPVWKLPHWESLWLPVEHDLCRSTHQFIVDEPL